MLIADNLHMFFGKSSPLESNSYLILGDEIVLVDAGMNSQDLVRNIENVGVKLPDIDYVVNTHCHFDHIRYNNDLRLAAGSLRFAAHKEDAPYIRTADPAYTVSKYIANNLKPSQVDLQLNEGGTIGGYEVIHTPGHTKGSICLLNRAAGILITGDTIFAQGFTGRTDLPGGSQEQLKDSLKKLEKFDLEKVLPGHQEPVLKDANENIKKALGILEEAYL